MPTEEQETAVVNKHSSGSSRESKKKTARLDDPYASAYGRVPWEMFRGRPWTYAGKLDGSMVGNHVLLLGNVMRVRPMGKTSTIVMLLSRSATVRCTVVAGPDGDEGVTTRMVRFAATLRRGTYLDIEGVVSSPSPADGTETDLLGTAREVEIHVRKLHTIGTNKDGSPVDGVVYSSD